MGVFDLFPARPRRPVRCRPEGTLGREGPQNSRIVALRTSAKLAPQVGHHQMRRRSTTGTAGVPSPQATTGLYASFSVG